MFRWLRKLSPTAQWANGYGQGFREAATRDFHRYRGYEVGYKDGYKDGYDRGVNDEGRANSGLVE